LVSDNTHLRSNVIRLCIVTCVKRDADASMVGEFKVRDGSNVEKSETQRLGNGISNLFLLVGMGYNPREIAHASAHQVGPKSCDSTKQSRG
jgi:hypothetical protein